MPPSTITIECHVDPAAVADGGTLADDVLDGLTRESKELPPKHFYDSRGSELFDRICELPEYYPTRTERAILEDCAAEIARLTRAVEVVELGSGSAGKTRVLLDALRAAGTLERYVPFDVSEGCVRECAEALGDAYPGLAVHGVVGDFEQHLDRVPAACGPRLLLFLGGTIGNFRPGSRRRFLRRMAGLLDPGDHLLLGTDLVKDPATLVAAYDDAAGVTAEFNRNVLRVINRRLGADFDPEAFAHVARWDAENEWIEMRLRALRACRVHIRDLGVDVSFAEGEDVRTEISAKFTRARVESDLASAGLAIEGWFTDAEERFALTLAGPSIRA